MVFQSYNCVLCQNAQEETLCHLFLHCPFAVYSWHIIGMQPLADEDVLLNLESFKAQSGVSFFMDIIIIMCWSINGA